MAVFRVEKNHNYTVMSNYHLRDTHLTLKAIGLLSKMLSLTDEWDYTTRGLAAICKEGVDAIGAALKELESHGYLVRRQLRDSRGRITDTEYTIYESPHTPLPDTACPDTENPYLDTPDTDEPYTEKTAQLNKDRRNKEKEIPDESITDTSNPDPIYPPAPLQGAGYDGMGYEEAREIVRENIEYDILVQDPRQDREQLDEVVDLIAETLCSRRQTIVVAGDEYPAEMVKEMVQELSERAAKVHSGAIAPTEDNMLKITSDGRKLGLDQRVINPDLPDDPNSKVNLCVNNIHRIWQDGQAEKLTQLVFCDLSTPKGKAAQSGRIAAKGTDSPELHALEAAIDAETEPEDPPFTIYDDIREKLIARGIPREQIAFIHEANTEVRKKELFAKVRSGQVRVLMGSTFKMGAGMNVQDRLVALHDLDCPWRPGDLEQRSGRIIRQGNRNKEVHIYRYVTESTFDAYLWQTVENKQKFISQIMTSKSPVRSCEDIDEAALSYAEIKALCAGDERIREKMDLDVDVARLRLMKANHQSQQYRLEDNILRHFPAQIEENKGFLSGFEADMKTLEQHPHPKDGFAGMEVKGDLLTDKDNAGAAILEAFKDAKGLESVPIGTYRGFAMSLTVENFGKDFILTLKGRMSHRVELGKDARGNLVRIDNALAQMPERYKTVQGRLENVQAQLATAKAELGKPFPQEAELKEKSARLAELNAELNIDDQTPMEQAAENVVAKRPSVLGKLKAPCVHGAGEKKKSHEQEAR